MKIIVKIQDIEYHFERLSDSDACFPEPGKATHGIHKRGQLLPFIDAQTELLQAHQLEEQPRL